MIDQFTKSVLTVIAAALVVLVAQNAIGPSKAQNAGVQKIAICTESGSYCAGIQYVNDRAGGLSISRAQ